MVYGHWAYLREPNLTDVQSIVRFTGKGAHLTCVRVETGRRPLNRKLSSIELLTQFVKRTRYL